MSVDFREIRLSPQELCITLDDLLEFLHEEDRSSDNPVVADASYVLEELADMADICGGYAVFEDVECDSHTGGICIAGEYMSTSGKICHLMSGAETMAVLVCTAGHGFTEYTRKYNSCGEYLKGYAADALGSIVAERAMDVIHDELAKDVADKGLKVTNRYSPGYCNWPVDDQKKLFSLLPSGVCGITLSASCLMSPIKSISGIVGIGPDVQRK